MLLGIIHYEKEDAKAMALSDSEWIATASILVRVEVEYGLAAVIPLCRDVVRMRRFFFGGVTA